MIFSKKYPKETINKAVAAYNERPEQIKPFKRLDDVRVKLDARKTNVV
jgi:hypothetical protein